MTFRVGFWTLTTSYITVLLLHHASLSTAGHLVFGAFMGGLLGLILASIFAGRANRTARMKLIHSVLRNKRDRVEKVRREIEALQIAIPLLIEDHAGKDSFSSTRAGHQLSA